MIGVFPEMRLGAVRAHAAEGQAPAVGGGELRTLHDGDLVHGEAGHVVQPVDGVAGEALEEPLLHHPPGAAAPLLRRLEDEMHRAGEFSRRGEVARGAEQHRRVSVVTAGVHLSRRDGLVGPLGKLRHGERVHVGAQPDAARAVADLQRAHDAGFAEAAMHLDLGFLQEARDDIAGALFLEAELRMRMQIAAQLAQEGQIGEDRVRNRHEAGLSMGDARKHARHGARLQ